MEPANLGVILDSSVAIEAERQHLNVAQFLKQIIQTIGEWKPICVRSRLPNWHMGSTARRLPSVGNAEGLSLMN
jgi:hypothetical protein